MSKELTGNMGVWPPKVSFNEKGQTFLGTLKKVTEGEFGNQFFFNIIEGTASIGRPSGEKNERGHNIYKEVEVAEGDEVQMDGASQLKIKLEAANVGDKIKIVYNGYAPNKKPGKAPFKDFKVTLED